MTCHTIAMTTQTPSNMTPMSHSFVLFGTLGDLSMRKLVPAWYQLERAGLLAGSLKMLGIDRLDLTTAQYRQHIQYSLKQYLPTTVLKPDICAKLQQCFTCQRLGQQRHPRGSNTCRHAQHSEVYTIIATIYTVPLKRRSSSTIDEPGSCTVKAFTPSSPRMR